MNQIAILLITTIHLPFSYSQQLTGDSFEDALRNKTATLTYVYNDETGCASMNEAGEMEGIMIELMEEFQFYVQDKYDISIVSKYEKIEDRDFEKFMNAVKNSNGGVFGLSYISITASRQNNYKFSLPFMKNVLVMATNENVQPLNSIEKIGTIFDGKTALCVKSSTYQESLEMIRKNYFPGMEIRFVRSELEAFDKIVEDNSYFAIFDLLLYLEFYRKKYPIKRHKVEIDQEDVFGIAMPLNSDWKPVLDEFFESGFLTSQRYKEIVAENLGRSAVRLVEGL
ncbi:MAG: transporter substrate-binding domain-containing protein [Cyclobacteriaceae bacterium]